MADWQPVMEGTVVADEPLLPKHGGYRRLKSFQVARLCYDVTVRFSHRYTLSSRRTEDQVVQAARSGAQNIAEGSQASGTSKKTELTLTNVARSSLEELRLDYEDYLRQHGLPLWAVDDPRRKALVARRCTTVEEVAAWVKEVHDGNGPYGRYGQDGRDGQGEEEKAVTGMSRPSKRSTHPEIAANAALILIGVACALLDRQIAALAKSFLEDGGFAERLYRQRRQHRDGQ